MRAGSAELVAQEIGEQHARLRLGLVRAAVHRQAHRVARIGAQARHCASSIICAAKPAHELAAILRGRVQVVARVERLANAAAHRRAPASLSVIEARAITGRSATPPTASLTLVVVATAAQATMAKSPCRRANSRNA